MKLDLAILASTNIKRKKPWSRIIWLGEQKESLVLLDPVLHRVSVLFVPSGKTKRKMPKLLPFIQDTVALTSTKNGRYLVGMRESGDIFLWYKDQDVFKIIPGFALLVSQELFKDNQVHLYPSNDCKYIFVVIGINNFYLWEAGGGLPELNIGEIQGIWHQIAPPQSLNFPGVNSPEYCVDALFYQNEILGKICQCSAIFNSSGSLHIITLMLHFFEPQDVTKSSVSAFSIEWSAIQYTLTDIHTNCQPINTQGSYVMSYTDDGQLIAIAANQKSAGMSNVLFVSPLIKSVLVADMKGCGLLDPQESRGSLHWVTDMAWTCDGLFVACMLKNGSVCILSRLGEPLMLQSYGCSVDMGPAYFLPLHPVVMIGDFDDRKPQSFSSLNSQHFSVSSHPSLPIILFSDGFMVTVLQLPDDLTCVGIMREHILESTRHLKQIMDMQNLDITLADAYKVHSGVSKSVKNRTKFVTNGRKKYIFEPEDSDSVEDSEESFLEADETRSPCQIGAVEHVSSGRVMFGMPDIVIAQLNNKLSGQDTQEQLTNHLEMAQHALLSAWKLSVCYPERWTAEVEELAKQVVWNTAKLFSLILDSACSDSMMLKVLSKQPSASVHTGIVYLLKVLQQFLNLLQFDMINQCMMTVAYRLVHQMLGVILTSNNLKQNIARLKVFSDCYKLLKIGEKTFSTIYVWMPKKLFTNIVCADLQGKHSHRYEPAILHKLQGNARKLAKKNDSKQDILPSKRLCASWKFLCRNLVTYQSNLSKQNHAGKELEQISQLLCNVQKKIHACEGEIPPSDPHINQGDKLSLEGLHTRAIDFWTEQLNALPGQVDESQKAGHLLHSVLYTYLLRGALRMGIDFVDSLILRAAITSSVSADTILNSKEELSLMTMVVNTMKCQETGHKEMVPCIRDKTIRQLVQTMARFMLAYFSNLTVYIFPPHNPQPLPTVHMESISTANRIIPIYHEDLTNSIRREGLSGMWSTERTLEYLLLSGLICEATWFADKMGDWKSAFQLAVSCTMHHSIAPYLYKKPKKPLQLPERLSPEYILRRKLEVVVQFDEERSSVASDRHPYSDLISLDDESTRAQLTKTLRDLFLVGTMCNVDLVSWLLFVLVGKLKAVISNFPPLVPQNFALPVPPPYCPQTEGLLKTKMLTDVDCEKQLRYKSAFLTKLVLIVLEASHLSLPLARWYLQHLYRVQEKASQFKSTTEGPCLELPEVLQQYNLLRSCIAPHQGMPSVHKILVTFRDFTALMWLMHIRDELSQNLKQRHDFLSKVNYEDYLKASWESKEVDSWLQHCFTTLRWAVNMLVFNHFLPDEGSTYKVILSLLLELPTAEDTADILAEHFHDHENLDTEVQEKLERLLTDWRGISITPEDDGKSAKPEQEEIEEDGDVRKSVTFLQASPRGEMLSVYFHKQCEIILKVFRKRRKVFGRHDEFVFSNTNSADDNEKDELLIGSRPYETRESFFEFLARFFDLSFTKLAETENLTYLPLLRVFSDEISSREFKKYAAKETETVSKNYSLVVMSSPRSKQGPYQSDSHISNLSIDERKANMNQAKHKGLFRSVSLDDADSNQHPVKMSIRRYDSNDILHVIAEDVQDQHVSVQADASPVRRKGKLTNLASKFSQSEEVLYRDPAAYEDNMALPDVNFGSKYQAISDLLDWLAVWCKKQQHLQLHKSENLELTPVMKIYIPVQLIILSLWLLENKYTGSSSKTSSLSYRELMASTSLKVEQHIPEHCDKARKTLEHSKEVEKLEDMKEKIVISEGSPKYLRRQQQISLQSTQDREEIKSAYEKVLDGTEDGSSLELSSLGSEELNDELKQTLSFIRGGTWGPSKSGILSSRSEREHSALNRTWHFESSRMVSDDHATRMKTINPQNKDHIIKKMEQFPEKSRSNPRTVQMRHSSIPNHHPTQVNSSHMASSFEMITANPGSVSGSADLAQQLQGIIRGELRRIMEVQHHSLMAMMGAIDGQAPPPVMSPWQPMYPVNQQQVISKSHRSVQTGKTLEETLSQGNVSSGSHRSKKKSRKCRSKSRNILGELENLQQQVAKKKNRSPSSSLKTLMNMDNKDFIESRVKNRSKLKQKENIDEHQLEEYNIYYSQQHHPEQEMHFIPKFLRIPAEKDTSDIQFKLPIIPPPFQAWVEDSENKKKLFDNAKIPLLHLDQVNAPSALFKGLYRTPATLMQFPHPQRDVPQEQLRNKPQNLTFQSPVENRPASAGSMGMPLLQLPAESKPFLTSSQPGQFGQLVAPHLIVGHEQDIHQQELLKQKYAREFHRQQVVNVEELEKQRFGQNLLQANLKVQRMKDKKAAKKRRRKKYDDEKAAAETQTESEVDMNVLQQEKGVISSSIRQKHVAGKTPEGSSEETEESNEQNSEDQTCEGSGAIHDGYAISPGSFDAYLPLEKELGSAVDSSVKMHYEAAKAIETHLQKEKLKYKPVKVLKDAWVGPDTPVPAETRIDKGMDPIQEALIEYNKSRQGHMLPPDIYMGLRFGEPDGKPASGIADNDTAPADGRSYLNVVDVNASMILKDLGDHPKDERIQPDMTLIPTDYMLSSIMKAEERIDDMETTLRESLLPEKPQTQDALTVKMFQTKVMGSDSVSVAVIPRESMNISKSTMLQGLQDMDQQMAVLNQMSRNMKRDFENTRLLLHTVEQLGEAAEEDSVSPIHSDKSPVLSRCVAAHTGKTISFQNQKESSPVGMSGLSGVSDIIQEMMAHGDIDLEEVGFSENEIHAIITEGRFSTRSEDDRIRCSVEKLKKFAKFGRDRAQKQDPEAREKLLEWMSEKRAKQQKEYRRERDELREREMKPFSKKGQIPQTGLTTKELQQNVKLQEEKRKLQTNEDMIRRMKDAEYLLGDILVEKPQLPEVIFSDRTTPKKREATLSPEHGEFGRTRVVETGFTPKDVASGQGILKPTRESSLPITHFEQHFIRETTQEMDRTGDTTGELKAYYAETVKAMETCLSQEFKLDAISSKSFSPEVEASHTELLPVGKPYKPKSFKDLVRQQRPEITRKKTLKYSPVSDMEYTTDRTVERVSARETSREEQEKIYGSKRLPSKKEVPPNSVRQVKTYAERLQEMKSQQTYDTPIVPRIHLAGLRRNSSVTSISQRTAKSHQLRQQPLTYVQRLQKLSGGTPKARAALSGAIGRQTYVLKSGKPPHKQRTYVEQLQSMQYHAPRPTSTYSTQHAATKMVHVTPTRGHTRTRPYLDPYRSEFPEGWERDSVLSDWSLDDRVRQLLYEDETINQEIDNAATEATSDYFDVVMGDREDYMESVDIDDIRQVADAVSISSGSVMSVIDWDAIDHLISDVY